MTQGVDSESLARSILHLKHRILYSWGHGIRELHLRVIRWNTCSSVIVSTHPPGNVQLITNESKHFF
jgi:hypothetical protein